jgi:environmental stress-induced protein Ves
VDLLRAHSRPVEPWANGRGRTSTVVREAGWRVSVATIDDASPFSAFPGLSRILMPLSPAGVVLRINGSRRVLRPRRSAGFAGEDAVQADELPGPAEVLNLMWQRDRHGGGLTALPVDGSAELKAEAGVLVAVVTEGRLTIAGGSGLSRLDALALHQGESVAVSGSGHLAVARVTDRRR